MIQGMIIGIGSDLIDIRRVEKVIERHGERFLSRIFTDAERARADRRTVLPGYAHPVPRTPAVEKLADKAFKRSRLASLSAVK